LPISIYAVAVAFAITAFAAYSVQHLHLKWIMAITLSSAAAAADSDEAQQLPQIKKNVDKYGRRRRGQTNFVSWHIHLYKLSHALTHYTLSPRFIRTAEISKYLSQVAFAL